MKTARIVLIAASLASFGCEKSSPDTAKPEEGAAPPAAEPAAPAEGEATPPAEGEGAAPAGGEAPAGEEKPQG